MLFPPALRFVTYVHQLRNAVGQQRNGHDVQMKRLIDSGSMAESARTRVSWRQAVGRSSLFARSRLHVWRVKENIAVYSDVEAIANWHFDGRLDVQVPPSDLGADLRHLAAHRRGGNLAR